MFSSEISLVLVGWFSSQWNVASYNTELIQPTIHVSWWLTVNLNQALEQQRRSHEAKTTDSWWSILLYQNNYNKSGLYFLKIRNYTFWWRINCIWNVNSASNTASPFYSNNFFKFFTTKALISHYLRRRSLVYDYILSKQWFSWAIWISYSKFYCNIGNKTNVFIGKKCFYSYLVCFIWIYARHNQTIVVLHPILLKMKKIKMIWNGACVLYDEFIVRLKKEQL